MKFKDLQNATPNGRKKMLSELVKSCFEDNPSGYIKQEIKAFEDEYEMSSSEMKKKVATGQIKETHDISEWQYLLNVLHLTQFE